MREASVWLPSPLEPVAMRLARADEAAFQIGRLALGWSREAFEMSEVERRPGWLDLVLKDIRPIPPLLVMLFSEAVHHLRAAVENVLFYLTELERGSALSSRHANAVTMPVKNTRVDFTAWQQRAVSTGVAELGPNTKLGKRIESLQPFVDTTASVPSLAPKLAASMGVRASSMHPMVLLQKYSNTDKHRSLRMAAARTTVTRDDERFADADRTMRPVAVGDVLASTRRGGAGTEVETQAAVHLERPTAGVWVAPGAELDGMFRHVSEIVIPTLVKGVALIPSLPPQIELGDTGVTWAERIAAGGWSTAKQRMDAVSLAALDEANATPPKRPRRDPTA